MMMRLLAILLITAFVCASCTALPAEERAFAVALCVEKTEDVWRVHGRIPTYQTGGGYLTVTGEGESLNAALADMEAAAPMRVTLSQLRLLVLDEALSQSEAIAEVLHTLGERPDLRMQCAVALTDAPMSAVAEALQPTTGARLSKAIDLLLESRVEQGVILPVTLADVLRLGYRQSAVLIALSVEDKAISLSGGYALTGDMTLAQRLNETAVALLSLLLVQTKELQLSLPGGNAKIGESSVRATLSVEDNQASVKIRLRVAASSLSEAALTQSLADECAMLLSSLSAAGCDVMGLGRQMIVHAHDMAEWHDMNWPARLQTMQWTVSVQAEAPA